MKILCYIFPLYLLALSCLPCGDTIADISHTQQTITIAGNHSHNQDACSPFCSCSCCATSIYVIAQSFAPALTYQLPIQQTISQPADLLSRYLSAIWQPPRLG